MVWRHISTDVMQIVIRLRNEGGAFEGARTRESRSSVRPHKVLTLTGCWPFQSSNPDKVPILTKS
jgi:hypothetical protein